MIQDTFGPTVIDDTHPILGGGCGKRGPMDAQGTAEPHGTSYARFVGRIGALAVALGIGAVLGTPVIAAADTGRTRSEDATSDAESTTESTASTPASRGKAASGRTAGAPRVGGRTSPGRSAGEPTTGLGERAAGAGAAVVRTSPAHRDPFRSEVDQAAPRAIVSSPSDAVPSPAAYGPLSSPTTAPAPTSVQPTAVVTPAAAPSVVPSVAPAAALPAAAARPVQARATTVAPIVGVLQAILAPLSGNGAGIPVESPLGWAVLALTRRLGRSATVPTVAMPVTTGQAAAATTVAPAATTSGTTTTITWAWGTNPVLNFNPATDKLNFGWMAPSAFTVTEKSGSTQIAIVDNNHSYTLQGVGLSQLQMSNIVAKDTGTVAKWQSLISGAQSTSVPTVSIANATVNEGNSGTSIASFAVSLSKAAAKTVTVGYSTANGTATAGQDFTAASGTLTFAPGVVSQTVKVAVTGDTAVEPTETFTVKLASPSGATLGTATATGTITNDDVAVTAPTVSIANATVTEGNAGTTPASFAVTLSKPSTATVTVGYSTANGTATAGQDFTAASGTLTFAPGVVSQTVKVAVTGDTAVEPTETFTVKLANPTNATLKTATATGTITNDDVAPVTPPTVSIANATVAEGNSGTSTMSFTVSLSKATDKAVTVGYTTANGTATAGQDYTAAAGTLTFAAGTTSQKVNVTVIGDTAVEPTETFTVKLANPTNATLKTATATGTITNDDTATPPPPVAGDRWGRTFYAPYVDMGGWPVPDLLAISQTNGGGSLFTAAFMQATPDGKLAWAGLNALEPGATNDQAQAINRSIKALQAAGGDVMISLGGQAGTSLAQWGSAHGMTAAQLANAYAGVIDTYGITHLDFDIEGAAVAEPASIALHSQALKVLQQSKPEVQIWYTLPVLPTGLTADGLKVVDSALKAGVTLAGVNVMAMDYGESAAPTSGPGAKTMGAYAIQSAESTYAQLSKLYTGYGKTFSYSQLGVTPMLGVNDVTTEVFTLADAQAVEDYARAKGVGMLALWSVTRDTPGQLGVSTYTHSGMSDPAGSFAKIFNDYGTVNPLTYATGGGTTGGSTTPVTGGTTTSIGWHWGTNTALSFNTSKDKLDFGWMQPTNFDISEKSGSTVITIVNNNQTYTLTGVPLRSIQMGNIAALDSATLAKWQAAITASRV